MKDIAFQQIAEEQYGIANFPTIFELLRAAPVLLSNTQLELDFPESADAILSSPNRHKIAYIGGANALYARSKSVPSSATTMEILERAKSHPGGIVLFALGTVLNTGTDLEDAQVEAIRQAMQQFPQHLFVWCFSKGDPRIARLNQQGIANIYVTDWVEQAALLGKFPTYFCLYSFVLNVSANGFFEKCPRNSSIPHRPSYKSEQGKAPKTLELRFSLG